MTFETARLIIHRYVQWADIFRAYRIFVDEVEMGRIRRNSTLDLEIPAGRHVIGAAIDWVRAEPILIDAQAQQTVHVEVSNTYGARKAEYAVTVGKDTYLTLKQLNGPPSR